MVGDAGLKKELYGLLTFEAIEERARLEEMWRKLCDDSLYNKARGSGKGLSWEIRHDMRSFVKELAKLLGDAGFQRIRQRDFIMSQALQDCQGVRRVMNISL